MGLQLESKLENKIHSLRKSLDSIVMLILGTCIFPVLWPIMAVLGPIYAWQRKRILADITVAAWLEENKHNDLALISKEKSIEGSIARIYLGGKLPWLPVVIPLVAVAIVVVAVLFV